MAHEEIAASEQWGAPRGCPGSLCAPSLYSHAEQRTDRQALEKITWALEKSRRRNRSGSGSAHARRLLGVISHLPPCFGVCFGECVGPPAAQRHRFEKILCRRLQRFSAFRFEPPGLWRDICFDESSCARQFPRRYIKYLERLDRWIQDGAGAHLEKEFAGEPMRYAARFL